jgi:hypothetical protein
LHAFWLESLAGANGGTVQNQCAVKIRWAAIALTGIFLSLASQQCYSAPRNARQAKSVRSGGAQIHFENTSSDDASPIRYVARTRSYDLYISREEADVVLHGGLEQSGEAERGKMIVVHAYANVLRMRFVDADPPTSVEQPIESGRRSLGSIAYRGIYPGTDAVLQASRNQIGFQVELSPGADTRRIVLEIRGATSINLDSRGNAVVRVGREAIVLQRPAVKIQSSGRGETSLGGYEIEGANRLRFIVNGNIPQSRATITD